MRILKTLAITLLLCILIVPLAAQSTSGTIVGTVTDPTGAVVAGANVTVTNQGTGIALKTTTDSTGNYVLTPVAVGTYSVTVESAGFKKSISSNITVNVQDRVRVDAALQVGEIVDTVEVAASAPLLQTDTSYLGQVVESQRIVDLPLNGRISAAWRFYRGHGSDACRCARREDRRLQLQWCAPLPEQLPAGRRGQQQHVRGHGEPGVLCGGTSAGRDCRVQGADQFHERGVRTLGRRGAECDHQIRHQSVARDGLRIFAQQRARREKFFDSPTDPIPPFKLNQFGFSAGGPIVKNRTFFFFDYQGTRQRTGHTFFATLPPPAWRNGDFSGFQPDLRSCHNTPLMPMATPRASRSQDNQDSAGPLEPDREETDGFVPGTRTSTGSMDDTGVCEQLSDRIPSSLIRRTISTFASTTRFPIPTPFSDG